MTEILVIDKTDPQPDRLERARKTLLSGGLVIIPTETVYGIACDPAVPDALKKLAEVKGRDGDKPISRLAADPEQVIAAAMNWNAGLQALSDRFWPGPLTIVLETEEGWIGFRVPDHAVAAALARACGHTLGLTSANLSGEPDSRTVRQAVEAIAADLALDSGPSAEHAVPSTVVKVDSGHIRCLREGCIPFEKIEQVFKSRG